MPAIQLLLSKKRAESSWRDLRQKASDGKGQASEGTPRVPELPWTLVTTRLHVASDAVNAMKRAGVIEVVTVQELRNPVNVSPSAQTGMELSPEQKEIVDTVVGDFDGLQAGQTSVSLIPGVVGSGKTEVYISIIQGNLRPGQTGYHADPGDLPVIRDLMRFYSHFGDRVSVVSSSLSEAERADQWERARRGGDIV